MSSASSLLCFGSSGYASSLVSLRAHISIRSLSVKRARLQIRCSSASFSEGSQTAEPDENPYKVLGINPFESFEKVKAAYSKKQKDAEKRGDEAALSRVSKDIKYADKQPIVPWGPRYAPSSKRDILINLAISSVFGLWIICTQSADWKPFQFLIFGYMWRVFDKLQHYEKAEPSLPSEDDDGGEVRSSTKGGKRLLRTLGLVFSSVAVCSLAYTGLLNGIELLGQYIPRFLINSQELIVTVATSVMLFFVGSYYR
ncbi:hypothetical protein KP509_03G028400 [Ceratopteris richardii]|uniref:Uncharacterized protein n=1 Tax=Ceratopteris richardii TaxID=49495 RepID=A0A8T2V213_CERRI|nr:hypothetical protein KP509_03G028400 [Ceratopteris richardii]